MTPIGPSELILIRHAPAVTGGRVAGRRDVPARFDDPSAVARLSAALSGVNAVVVSPALRCRQTAEALFPGRGFEEDDRLWEQDFGQDEGRPYADLPDLGPMTREALANIASPEGESFADMIRRVTPALQALADRVRGEGSIAVVAHAGTVRALLSLALGNVPAALAFEVDPLSATRVRFLPDALSIISVNGHA